MIRKLTALAGLSVLGAVTVPGVALAYTAPDQANFRLLIEANAIRVGDTDVPFESQQLMPNTPAQFTITKPNLSADHLPVTVTESGEGPGEEARGNVGTTTTDEGKYGVSAVLPEIGIYTITSEGTDLNGQPSTLTMQLKVGALATDDSPSFIGYAPLIGGAALALVGGGFFVLARRRHDEEEDPVVSAHTA